MEYQVKGTFWKKDGIIYRNRTKIIFNGNEDNCIGIILMLNPGSSLPKKGENGLKEEGKEYYLICLCEIDYTLRKLPICILESYIDCCQLLNGYILIINLSNRCKTKPKDLLEEDFRNPDEVVAEIKEEIKEPHQVNWIWVAVGKDKKLKLCAAKKENILLRLQKDNFFKNKLVGVDSMHPSAPLFDNHQNHDVINEIRNKLK